MGRQPETKVLVIAMGRLPSEKEGLVRARLRQREHDAGFTIVEVLVGIAILGILAGIVVFSVSGVSSTSQTAACTAEKSTLQAAQEAYFAKNNAYAVSAATLKTAGYLATLPTWYLTDKAVAPYEVITNVSVAGNPCQ